MNLYTCIGNKQHLTSLFPGNSIDWTMHKDAKIGDYAVFYLTAPISAVVAFGKITGDAYFNIYSEWQDKYFAEVKIEIRLDETQFITNRELRNLFSEWKYIAQPRRSVLIAPDIASPLVELIRERAGDNSE